MGILLPTGFEPEKLGYSTRILILATLPHSKPEQHYFERQNGDYRLVLLADPRFGLPYGAWPRLLLAWIAREAVRTRSPVIELGNTLADFMATFNITPTGGERGTITYLKDHMLRLFSTSIRATYADKEMFQTEGFCLVNRTILWWDPQSPRNTKKDPSRIQLSKPFFDELLAHPVPLHAPTLGVLRKSPMALDIYSWLTYRFFRLKKPTVITWGGLALQFGADFQLLRTFRQRFRRHLKTVKGIYVAAGVEDLGVKGIRLTPSPPHVPRKKAH